MCEVDQEYGSHETPYIMVIGLVVIASLQEQYTFLLFCFASLTR